MTYTLLKTLALTLISVGLASPSLAGEVEASTMKYTNDGGYTAQFYIRYNLDDGSNCKVRPKSIEDVNMSKNDSATYYLTDKMFIKDGGSGCLDKYGYITEGREVWGYVEIAYGTNESCKKNKKVIFKTRGDTIKYKTKGTTLKDNRCRVSSWP